MKRILALITLVGVLLSTGIVTLGASALVDTSILYGDYDGDGTVDLDDARDVLMAAAGLESVTDPEILKRADVNSDGVITLFDARQVLRGCADLTNLQPSGKFSGFEGDDQYTNPEQAIASFNILLNRVKTQKPGFTRMERADVINFNIGDISFKGINFGNSAESISQMIRDRLVTESEPQLAQTVLKGQNCDNAMSAETKTYVSNLSANDVYGVKASYNEEVGEITIQIALADCEIANVTQTAYADVFNPGILQENSESTVENIFGANTFDDARKKELKNAVLTVVVDSETANVISYTTVYETHMYLENSKFGVNTNLSAELKNVEYATRVAVTYDNFQW